MCRTASELRLTNNSWKRRTVRAIQYAGFALLFGLLFPVQSYAILIGAGQFDKLIQKAEIVVKARVNPIDESAFGIIDFEAEIITVLKSDGTPIPNRLFLKSAIFIWPGDLGIPFTEQQIVLLVLQRRDGQLAVVNNMRAILPATDSKMQHDNCSSATKIVFNELCAFLPQAEDKLAKGLVLVLLSQLATREDEKMFLPYMKRKNKWLRRAALASLLRINPTTKRIQMAVGDFNDHLCTPFKPSKDPPILVGGQEVFMPPKNQLFWKMYQDVQWAARCGAWGMEKNMTARAKAYLPIYRVLIDKAPPNYQRVHVAISGLKNVGIREDILRLYKYLDDEKTWMRHDVLEGIGRILGMKIKRPSITSYCMPLPPNVEPWEKEARSTIERALVNENLLSK